MNFQADRDRLRLQEGLHGLPEGLHEEGGQVPGGERPRRRGRRLQEEHLRSHEGPPWPIQGSPVLHW